jgi:two-component system response regulator AtoC
MLASMGKRGDEPKRDPGSANEAYEVASADISTTVADISSSSAPSALQLMVLESTGLTIYPLPESGNVSIGRAEDCDIRIGDALASRHHATLHLAPLSIADGDSANGTRLGSRRLSAGLREQVAPGQAIGIGAAILIVRRADAAASRAHTVRSVTPQPFAVSRAMVVHDPAMQKLYALIERLARGQISVLILGETGVGKEVIADAIHRASTRRSAPILKISCATLSEALLESELFGHERGAFTGAATAKPGLVEVAHGGTVFLDEVGELSPPLQAKLLRLLETREVLRIGGLRSRPVDVRFLFATNRDLEQAVACGTFRADLFFRLKGAVIEVPPLRERSSEILPLAQTFLVRAAEQMQLAEIPKLSEAAEARLVAHSWPGNVRELRNEIERAALLWNGGEIRADELALGAADPRAGALAAPSSTEGPPTDTHYERERIAQALLDCGGNQSRAAESLGIPRRTLVRKIAQFGLPRPRKFE